MFIGKEAADLLECAIRGSRSCHHISEEDLKRIEDKEAIAAWGDMDSSTDRACTVLARIDDGYAVITEGEDYTGHGCQCFADLGFYQTMDLAIRLGLTDEFRHEFLADSRIDKNVVVA
jgi:hypothetical protein